MAQQYLIKCDCGTEHAVEASQAGDTIQCQCGRAIEVPSLRELKALPTAQSDAASKPKKTRSWHPLQGVLFGLGAVLLVVGSLWAGGLFIHRSRLDLEPDPRIQQQLEENLENIAKLDIEQTYKNWELVKQVGLGQRQPPAYVINREFHEWWGKVAWGMLGVAAVGVGLIALSLVIKPQRQRRPRSAPRQVKR